MSDSRAKRSLDRGNAAPFLEKKKPLCKFLAERLLSIGCPTWIRTKTN
jgi:hypothetical protein